MLNLEESMSLESIIGTAQEQDASDLHLEAGLPAAFRIRGALRTVGEPIGASSLTAWARELIGEFQWQQFLERRSFDLSRTIQGVRCRINILQTSRGVGFAIRLLSTFQATIDALNLHPDLKRFVDHHNGLLLVSGPTGCGKSSTLAALIQEINVTDARHVVTIESPIEYLFRPRKAFLRQREVGRDTPSFEQGLLDALREDPDVLMVGEMRDAETMRLTLNAAETGHLVLSTVHSSTCVEALQRIVAAFPAEIQTAVAAQLADCLVGVIAQRLHFRPDLNIRLPECEILTPTNPVKAHIRNREFFRISSVLETGGDHGMWTFQRYRSWMEKRTNWRLPGQVKEPPDSESDRVTGGDSVPAAPPSMRDRKGESGVKSSDARLRRDESGRIEIEPEEGGFGRILKKPD